MCVLMYRHLCLCMCVYTYVYIVVLIMGVRILISYTSHDTGSIAAGWTRLLAIDDVAARGAPLHFYALRASRTLAHKRTAQTVVILSAIQSGKDSQDVLSL